MSRKRNRVATQQALQHLMGENIHDRAVERKVACSDAHVSGSGFGDRDDYVEEKARSQQPRMNELLFVAVDPISKSKEWKRDHRIGTRKATEDHDGPEKPGPRWTPSRHVLKKQEEDR